MNSNDRQGQRQCNGTIIWYLLFSSTLGCSIVWLFNKHVLADCNDHHHSTKMVSEIIDSGYLPYWTYFVVCHNFFLSPTSWWLKQCAMSEFNSKHGKNLLNHDFFFLFDRPHFVGFCHYSFFIFNFKLNEFFWTFGTFQAFFHQSFGKFDMVSLQAIPWYGVIAGFRIDFIWIFPKCCFILHNPLSHLGRLFIKTHLFIRSTIKCDHFEWFNAFESCKKQSKKTLGHFKVHI